MLRLTSLAPDIIEAILRGDEPDGLSLEKLRKNLPVRWDEQRERWNKMIWGMQPALASRASVFGEGPLHEVRAKKGKLRLTAQTASC